MIRVTGTGTSAPASGPRRTAPSSGAFRVEGGPKGVGAPSSATPAAPVETLGALIALQSDAPGGGKARVLAAAKRTLDLLERLRLAVIEGAIPEGDLALLADAASASAGEPGLDPGLAALHEDVALRARVELAKLGR